MRFHSFHLRSTVFLLLLLGTVFASPDSADAKQTARSDTQSAKVTSVVDGDTIKVKIGTKTETIRIIGIDTPETVDPRKPVQCFGKETAAKMKSLVNNKIVTLERNPAEERDIYKRLLRYVWLNDEDIGAKMISEGYAFSYKVFPHPKLNAYNKLEQEARTAKVGLWGNACNGKTTAVKSSSSSKSKTEKTCDIKGNISTKKGEKIYHVPGCASYDKTVIDESAGERMFCTEKEAKAAGWRKALNCP